MEMYQIISKYYNIVKRILIEDEIPPTFENLKYYFKEDDILREIKEKIGSPMTIRLIYLIVLSERGVDSEKIKDVINKLKVYNIKKYVDLGNMTVTCDECGGYGSVDCDYCDGNGDVACRNCDGSGTEIQTEEVDDGDEIEVEVECSSCDGSGKESCSYCGGDGQFDCDECGGSGEYESYDEYFQPDNYFFVKPYSSKDDDYLGKPYEIDKLTDFFENGDLSMFLGKMYEGFSDYDADHERREYNTDLSEFETVFEITNLDYVSKRLF